MRQRAWMAGAALMGVVAGCSDGDEATSGADADSGASGAGGAGASTSSGAAAGGGSAGAGGSNGGAAGSAGSGGGATGGASGSADSGAGATSSGGTGGGGTGGVAGSDSGGAPAIPTGGTVLFTESFDDASFSSRGWYDGPSGTIDASEAAPGSSSSYRCDFATGATGCTGGTPARNQFASTESAYLSFWIKFSANWVGSGRAYHPHMFHFINDRDTLFVGPAHTYLTTYTEVVDGQAMLALQDSKNVDLNCIQRNDLSFVGCNGDFDTYVFTEDRSVCACNGIVGELDGRDCFANGNGTWYSSRAWRSADAFVDTPGPNDKTDWHFVEVYFEMNSVPGGVGVPDGKIRWVQDGQTLISSDQILLRTGANATLAFNQFAMLPYIGDGSPVDQSFWVDEMTVATAKP